jgi:hypothetical protein
MQKRSRRKRNEKTTKPVPETNEPWISMGRGLVFIGVVSVATAVLFTWRLSRVMTLGEALLWGVGYGIGVWAVFGLALAFNKWARGR